MGIGIGIGILMDGHKGKRVVVFDDFTRADNPSTLGNAVTGQSWNLTNGTWGIQGNRAYCVSDVGGNLVGMDIVPQNFILRSTMTGQYVGTDKRYPYLIFRYLNGSNYLLARYFDTTCELVKVDAGVNTQVAKATVAAMTNGVQYDLKIILTSTAIVVFINDTAVINYALTGDESKFLAYPKAGLRMSKSGSPTMPAQWLNFSVEEL